MVFRWVLNSAFSHSQHVVHEAKQPLQNTVVAELHRGQGLTQTWNWGAVSLVVVSAAFLSVTGYCTQSLQLTILKLLTVIFNDMSSNPRQVKRVLLADKVEGKRFCERPKHGVIHPPLMSCLSGLVLPLQ
jgi:hypothetical protein